MANATGQVLEILPLAGSASALPTMKNSNFFPFSTSVA
jgi:hypothetical protein